jgi:hypothetical protein
MTIPSVSDVFAADRQAVADEVTIGLCDRIEAGPDPDEPVPFTLTAQAEAALADPEWAAEAEAEWADEWDSADSHAYMDRVEAGLEPEVEP